MVIKIQNNFGSRIILALMVFFTIWSYVLPGITTPFGTMFPLRIMSIICGVLFLIQKHFHKIYSNYIVPLLVLCAIGIISLVWCISISSAITGLFIYVTDVLTFFMVLYLCRDKEDVVFISKIIVINLLIIGLMGIRESFEGVYYFPSKEMYERSWVVNSIGKKYPHVFFNNTNDFGTLFVAMLPICGIATANSKHQSIIQFGLLGFCIFCVFLTSSRLCLLLCAGYTIWLLFKYKNSMRKFIISSIAVLMICYIGYRYGAVISSHLSGIYGGNTLGGEDRWLIWYNSLVNVVRSGFIGVGVGNSSIANQNYSAVNVGDIYMCHNLFIEILMDFGLIGLVVFVYFLARLFKNTKKYKEDYIAKYFLAFLILFFFLTICSSTIKHIYYFWLVFGMCAFYCFKMRCEDEERGANVYNNKG